MLRVEREQVTLYISAKLFMIYKINDKIFLLQG